MLLALSADFIPLCHFALTEMVNLAFPSVRKMIEFTIAAALLATATALTINKVEIGKVN